MQDDGVARELPGEVRLAKISQSNGKDLLLRR
jgi:hypothetical protein